VHDPPRSRSVPEIVTVTISRRTIFLVFAIVAAVWVALHLISVLIVVFSAILLATAIDQPVSWLQRRGVPRSAGVLLMYLMVVAIIAGVVALLIPLVTSEISTLQDELPTYAKQLEDLVRRLSPTSSGTSHFTFNDLATRASQHLDAIARTLTDISFTAAHVVVLVFITFVAAYYLAVSPDEAGTLAERFVPAVYRPRIESISRAVSERIGDWVRGQVLVAGTFGVGMGIGFWLLGIPFAATLGVVAGVLELIPYVGGVTTLALAIPLALTIDWLHAAGVLVLYVVLVNIEAHVLSPWYVGRAVHLPPVIVLVALVAGAELAGLVGVLLAVPMTVVLVAVVDEVWPAPATSQEPQSVDATTGSGQPPGG
jgi:predicted PurR-regulated permease PerM